MVDDATQSPELDQLRADFPLWRIDSAWTARPSGPDFRVLVGCRAGVRFAGFSAAELARMMSCAERRYGWPRCAG